MAQALRIQQPQANPFLRVVEAPKPRLKPNTRLGTEIEYENVGYCVRAYWPESFIKIDQTYSMTSFNNAQLALWFLKSELMDAELEISGRGFLDSELSDLKKSSEIMDAILTVALDEKRPGRFILDAMGMAGAGPKDAARKVWEPIRSAEQ